MEQNTGIRNVLKCVLVCSLTWPCDFVQYCGNGGTCALYAKCTDCTTVFVNCFNGKPPTTVSRIQPTPNVCDVNKYLITGPNSVADNQLSESSFYRLGLKATFARLTSSGTDGCWVPASRTASEYIQVDFLTIRQTTGIVLTDRAAPSSRQYVTAFKVLYSHDCVNFTHGQDGNGNEKIFVGCSYGEEVVTRMFEQPVPARCIRINPISRNSYPSLRFDVLGC